MEKIGKNNFKNGTDDLTHIVTKFPKRLLQIWFKPIKTDSLRLAVAKDKYEANFTFKFRSEKDTLNLSAVQINDLKFRDRFTIEAARH
jgi:hypothetical protein